MTTTINQSFYAYLQQSLLQSCSFQIPYILGAESDLTSLFLDSVLRNDSLSVSLTVQSG